MEIVWLSNYFSVFLYIVLLIPCLLYLRKKTRSNSLNLPPSPPKLPLIGNLHQLGQNIHRSLRDLSDKYGPLMLLDFGRVPTLIVSLPEIVQEITELHDVVFSNRPNMTASEILFYGNKDVAFSPYGDVWRQARKVCVVELLSHKRVRSFHPVRDEEADEMVSWIAEQCQNGNSSVNLSEALARASDTISSKCILGTNYDNKGGLTGRLGQLSTELSMQLLAFCVGDFFPSLRWIDSLSGFVGRLRASFREFDEFNDRIVEQHKAVMGSLPDGASNKKDFVDILLQLQRDGSLSFELTQDHIKAILKDMLVAGGETTTTALEWLIAELLRNPPVMRKAQEELREIIGKKAKIEADDINQMNYLKCAVKETLRLHPPAPLLLAREVATNVQIAGFDVPAKTRVLINAWAIQRNPSFWENPEEFSPERFENSAIGAGYEYIPFGFGRRICPGSALGIMNLEHLAANLLYWFDWESQEDIDMSEECGITVHKKVPLRVVATPYCP